MKILRLIQFMLVLVLFQSARAAELDTLKVLYIGDARSPRASEFKEFLKLNVGQVEVADRRTFKPQQAEGFDVVLLDWPQSARQEGSTKFMPLGERQNWTKPTVLLGSAGLNLAIVWEVKGGFG